MVAVCLQMTSTYVTKLDINVESNSVRSSEFGLFGGGSIRSSTSVFVYVRRFDGMVVVGSEGQTQGSEFSGSTQHYWTCVLCHFFIKNIKNDGLLVCFES